MQVGVPAFLGRPLRYFLEIPSHLFRPRFWWSSQPWSGQMDSRYGFGMSPSQLGRYPGSEVAAMSEIALIAEHVDHQPMPYLSDLPMAQALLGGRPGKPEPGPRWHHHVEGVPL